MTKHTAVNGEEYEFWSEEWLEGDITLLAKERKAFRINGSILADAR
jgi:hypothetical protein